MSLSTKPNILHEHPDGETPMKAVWFTAAFGRDFDALSVKRIPKTFISTQIVIVSVLMIIMGNEQQNL